VNVILVALVVEMGRGMIDDIIIVLNERKDVRSLFVCSFTVLCVRLGINELPVIPPWNRKRYNLRESTLFDCLS
jgi:hypothetical protein